MNIKRKQETNHEDNETQQTPWTHGEAMNIRVTIALHAHWLLHVREMGVTRLLELLPQTLCTERADLLQVMHVGYAGRVW